MLFPSIVFLFCFLPVLFFLYFVVCRKNRTMQNIILFIGSVIFYAYGEGWVTLLLMFSIGVNYIAGLLVERFRSVGNCAKWTVGITAVINVGILIIYKYLDFLLENINGWFGVELPLTGLALPIGISFFTFQAMSYVVDVYREKAKVQKNPLYVGLYIMLFPQLIAGPIVRYETVALQMKERRETIDRFSSGTVRFIAGMGKKVLIADTMAIFADRIFGQVLSGTHVTVAMAWLGAICYSFQIFYDFSGYSDMAIGLGRMFGFEFEENFNYPYISKSVKEFWRRWHISLSTWFRDYVYIPLGGNRGSAARTYLNLFIVWLLTGVWHGAGWTFVVWGLMYFAFLTLERAIGMGEKWKLPSGLAHIYTLIVVIVGWTIFRSATLADAGIYLANMFGITSSGLLDGLTLFYIRDNWVLFVGAVVFSTPMGEKLKRFPHIAQILLAVVFLVCIVYIIRGAYSPFIYFSF